jgi:hypothetical protein
VQLANLVSLPFWVLAGLGFALAGNVRSLAEESSLVAARTAARSQWLQSDQWDRTPAAIRWYGLGLAWAALYGAAVVLGLRWLAAISLGAGLVTFFVSTLRNGRGPRPLGGWGDRLRFWQLAGWTGSFLVAVGGVVLASWLGVR